MKVHELFRLDWEGIIMHNHVQHNFVDSLVEG